MPVIVQQFPFDATGTALTNKITNEPHVLTAANGVNFHLIIPDYGPYFADSLVIRFTDAGGNTRTLTKGIDYNTTHWFIGASKATALPIYGSISFLDLALQGTVHIDYQTVGGEWVIDSATILQILANVANNPRTTAWEQVAGYPTVFPPTPHAWNLTDMVGMSALIAAVNAVEAAIYQQISSVATAMAAQINGYNKTEVDTLLANLSTSFNTALTAESTARAALAAQEANDITALNTQITAINASITALQTALAAETNNRAAAEAALTLLIANAAPNIEDEMYWAASSPANS